MRPRPEDHLPTASRPSALKITDLRTATVGWDGWRFTLIRLDTNQGLSGYGEVRDGASRRYALMLKIRPLGENPCNVNRLFRKIKQFGHHGRLLGSVGQALGEAFTILESADKQQLPSLVGNGERVYLLAWEDDGNGNWDIYGRLFHGGLDQTAITYIYDPLFRLTGAAYTGAISATFVYQYDAVGNHLTYRESL